MSSPSIGPGRAVAGGARGVDRDLPDALAQLGRRRPATASPRRASGGGAGSCSRARRGGSRCRARLRAPAPRRDAGLRGIARRRRPRRRSTTGPRGCAASNAGSASSGPSDDPHPLAAAARRRLHEQRVAELARRARTISCRRADRLRRAGDDRHAGRLHPGARGRLVPHQLDRLGRRADPDEPCRLDRTRERGVLGEKAVAGMDRLGARALGRGKQLRDVEVVSAAVRRRARTPRRRGPTWSAARSASE